MNNASQWKKPACLLLAAVLLAGLAAPVLAQDTTSSIRGVVKDANGPVPGATVVAVDAASGFRRAATGGEDGRYSLPGLRPATYEIQVSSEAYSAQARTVTVLLGQDVEANFLLSPTEMLIEGIDVVGEATQLLLDTRSSEISTNITTQQIESLPQNSRNFLSFAALAPGVRFTENQDDAGQKFRSGGADARQVNVFVDGLSDMNDLLQGGAFMQDSSRGNPFPQGAVQEYRILTQNYKAEYEKAAAAVITAITKSGGNELHGDAFFLFQDKSLVTQDDFAKARGEKEPEYSRDQYGLSLGGPIVKDKLQFFVTYEGNDQDRNASVFRGSQFSEAPANVQNFLGGFQTGTLTSPLESKLFFGKLSWQPAPEQTVEVSYHLRDEQEVRGFGGQRTIDGAESFEVGTDSLVVRHTWVLGNALNEASATMQQLSWNPAGVSSTTPRLNYIGILDVGGKDATQDFVQDKIGLRDDFTFMPTWHGPHAVKSGVSVNWLEYEVTKELFANGLFEFRTDEDWQFPFQARLGFGEPSLKFDNTQLGLYIQDDWQVLPNLTLNLGVRWDYETDMLNNDYVTPPNVVAALQSACRTYGQPVGGQTTWCLRDFLDLDRYTTDGDDRDAYTGMIQPRFGFSWDVSGRAETVIFGGWGLYYDRVILNDIYDEAYRQQYSIFSFCFSADGSPTPNCSVPAIAWRPEFQSAEGLAGLIASGQSPGPEIWLVPNDMKPPKTEQYTLGVRQKFGRWLTSLSYAGVEGRNSQIQFFGDNPPGTAFNDRFGGNVPVPGFGRVFVATTAGRTWYDGVFLTVDKPYSDNWALNLAYTYAKASKNGQDNPGEGLQFGAFDYGNAGDLYKFPGANDERHRIVLSGTVGLPWNFTFSSLITLGTGVPFTVFDGSGPVFRVRWNEGRQEGSWPYQSIDARVDWEAPPVFDRVTFGLSAEGFNLADHDNYGCFDNFKPAPPAVSTVGKPNCENSTRRFQIGARVRF
jgi:outer membrane receptor protein involved in Fe transport